MAKAYIVLVLIIIMVSGVEARDVTHEEWQVLQRTERFYREDKMQDIVALLRPFTERASAHEAVYSYMSSALLQQGKYDEAYSILDRATRLYPEDFALQYNFAITAMHLEKYQAAISSFALVSKIQKEKGEDISQIKYYMATAYYMLEEYDRVIEILLPLIYNQNLVNRQNVQLAINCYIMKQDWEKGEKIVGKWIEISPTSNDAWKMLGDMLIRQKKYKKAAGAYEIANLLGGKNISPGNLFQIYRYLNAHSEAARWAEHPELITSHWLDRAKELYQAAKFAKTLQILDKEEGASKDPEVIILRGKNLLALGKIDEAIAAWLSCEDLPLPKSKDPRKARRKRDEMTAVALILAGEARWEQKEWLKARDIFKKLSYLPGYENTGNSLASAMQYLLDNMP